MTESQERRFNPRLNFKPPHISMNQPDEFQMKTKKDFRNYEKENVLFDRVKRTYKEMHSMQSVKFVNEKIKKWCNFDHDEMTIMEVLGKMESLVDESDPDVNVPNSVHAFQTAERIRKVYPDNDWLQLTGLIHDLGKLLAVWGEPQSSVVGDTFPVGCAFSDKIVYGSDSFMDNEDYHHPVFRNKLGMYSENCGLQSVLMSWGHDEYLYRVLRNHESCHLPEEALYIIRFHSFYPWHTCGDYYHLCDDVDLKMLCWVKEFNKFDLYSKADADPDIKKLTPYYEALAEKYLPGKINW